MKSFRKDSMLFLNKSEGKGVKYWNCDCLIGVFPRIFPQKFIIISGRRLPCSTVILSKALENHNSSYLEKGFRIFKIFDKGGKISEDIFNIFPSSPKRSDLVYFEKNTL